MCLVEGEGAKGGKGDKVRIGLIAAMPSTGEIVWDGTFFESSRAIRAFEKNTDCFDES